VTIYTNKDVHSGAKEKKRSKEKDKAKRIKKSCILNNISNYIIHSFNSSNINHIKEDKPKIYFKFYNINQQTHETDHPFVWEMS